MPTSVKKSPHKANNEKKAYFALHDCTLTDEDIQPSYEIKCGRFRRFILDWTTVNTSDIRANYMYRSYAALCAEKYRQFSEYPLSIHPFSKLRVWVEAIVALCILISNSLLPFWFSKTNPGSNDPLVYVIHVVDTIYFVNIIPCFLTGYVDGKNKQYVVLNIRKITWHYVKTWFIIDAINMSSMIICAVSKEGHLFLQLTMVSLKILRTPILYTYVSNLCTVVRMGMPAKTAVELTLWLCWYLSWNIVFQFSVEYLTENSLRPTAPRHCSWITIAKLWNASSHDRFLYSLERAVGMLRNNANLNLNEYDGCFETFFIVAWLIAEALVLHCSFKFMLALFGFESARAKYYMMAKQVQNYMYQRRLPPRIQRKIQKFYAIRFQSHFFVESRMMACVSGQLREDMLMYTGRKLVKEVPFLKQLPRSLLLQISLRFRLIIFIEGDVIFKINTLGDNIYFIHKGTVAIYSESGREVFHFEDGDYFGEIALVMRHKFRTNSAVAVTNCELFALSREDFESIACYPTVYEDIKKAATSRLERILVLDEQYKAQISTMRDSID